MNAEVSNEITLLAHAGSWDFHFNIRQSFANGHEDNANTCTIIECKHASMKCLPGIGQFFAKYS